MTRDLMQLDAEELDARIADVKQRVPASEPLPYLPLWYERRMAEWHDTIQTDRQPIAAHAASEHDDDSSDFGAMEGIVRAWPLWAVAWALVGVIAAVVMFA